MAYQSTARIDRLLGFLAIFATFAVKDLMGGATKNLRPQSSQREAVKAAKKDRTTLPKGNHLTLSNR
jgi:hypothetical protein